MALVTRKSISLNGSSTITMDNATVTVVSLAANISEDGNSNIVTTIVNHDMYEANKTECRADMDAFTQMVREIEDSESEV